MARVAEAGRIDAGGQQQHVPAEEIDEAGDQRDVDAGHVDAERMVVAVGLVVVLKALGRRRHVDGAQRLPRIEVEDLFRIGGQLMDRVAPIDTAGRVFGVAHVGAHIAQIIG